MEKLYMQDSQQEKGRKQKKGLRANVSFSVALSVLVAAFALFSVASFGLINAQKDTVSYAAPADGFTMLLRNTDADEYAGVRGYKAGSSDFFYVPFYYANTASEANRIYCIQKSVGADNGVQYQKGGVFDDPGLVYILEHSYANGTRIVGGGAPDFVEIWATQAAIWLYASKHFDAEHNAIPATGVDSLDALKNADTFIIAGGAAYVGTDEEPQPVTVSGVYSKIEALVSKAEAAADSEAQYTMRITSGDELTLTSDKKYYQTPVISVTANPANSFKRYDITSVTGISGIKVVDENGHDLALTNIPAGKKFYLRIPASAVTEKTQRIEVNVKGYFKSMMVAYYVGADDHQQVIVLDEAEQTRVTGQPFEIVGSPDTGMNAAQTIYFIGLIVLLCGVGIVYANTKPVESKQ